MNWARRKGSAAVMVLGSTRRCSKSSGKSPHVSSKISESSFAKVSKSGRDRGRRHLARRKGRKIRIWMPRPCAVETHARSYQKGRGKVLRMPRPCAVETHARSYQKGRGKFFADATALRRGASRSQLPKRLRKVLWDATHSVRNSTLR